MKGKGKDGYCMGGDTARRIGEHIKKHRASGGSVESDRKGDDDAEKDLGEKNMEYTKDSNVNREAGERKAKRGGRMEKKHLDGKMEGEKGREHMGKRKRRASGGAAESNPFTTAHKGSPAKGRGEESCYNGMAPD